MNALVQRSTIPAMSREAIDFVYLMESLNLARPQTDLRTAAG